MAIKAVFFDIDGTLVDSNDFHVQAWDEAFRQAGFDLARTRIHAQIGKGTDHLVPALLPDADEALGKSLGETHSHAFKSQYLDRVKPFDDAAALLKQVQARGQTVVLASSASGDEVTHYIDLLDATNVVSATTSADEVASTKPAPDIFSVALEKVAPLTPSEIVVVGDTPYDVEAAAKCGIAAIGLRSGGFSDADLIAAGAIALYDGTAALLADYDASPLAR